MFEKLKLTEQKYEEISNKLTDPEVISDNKLYASLMKEYKNLTPVVEKYREYVKCKKTMEDARELLDEAGGDKEMKELAQLEFDESKETLETLNEELKILLLPKDPNDDKNVIIEIRGGAGGEEASLFAGSLYRMYTMYAEARRWKTEILNSNETELGGFKEVSFSVEGDGAYSRFKYESGVHRVQRVPETESQGRIHTSTVTVAVLAEADEVELEIAPTDLKIDVFRASGAGGQHINKTESAVRITHLPTGVVVECQDERSQHKNKDKAMKILRSRLYEALLEEQNDKIASERKSQVGTGNRSERIRTYNFPESRVTDHRIGLTLYRLESILNGSLDEVIDALATADQAAKLSAQLTKEDA
ncbi:MAG: peptide chain release factor 1 [Ruminococcus sp.]|nr:peptide chain release factor 1 [Ruminococcus sp.]